MVRILQTSAYTFKCTNIDRHAHMQIHKHTHARAHTHTHTHLRVQDKVPNIKVTMNDTCNRAGVHTIGTTFGKQLNTLSDRLTDALPALRLLTTGDVAEDVALWKRPKPPPPPANSPHVVSLSIVHLQKMIANKSINNNMHSLVCS